MTLLSSLAMSGVRRRARAAAAAVLTVTAAACSVDLAPQFAPDGNGTLTGIVFYDADNDGTYSPVVGDSALAGVGVQLRNRGTDETLARVTTDASGRFSLSVPVGTGDLFVESSSDLTARGFVFCGGRATTYLDEQTFVNVPIKLGCVIDILDAKLSAVGARITIAGVVTAQPGRFRAQGDNLYMQDASSGIQLFGGSVAGLGIEEGDSIEVTGDYSPFSGEPEIGSPQIAANIKKGVGVPAALERTVEQLAAINSGNAADVGRLVVVRTVRIGELTGTGTGRNATLTAVAGPPATSQVRFDGNVFTDLGAQFTPATQKCYDVTGVLGFFTSAVQLKPRFAADFVEVPCN